jgi:hypothetical protein
MISTALRQAVFYGSGSTGPFTFNFQFFANSDIEISLSGREVTPMLLVEGSDYALTGAGLNGSGGTVTLTLPLAIGESLTVSRVLDYVQATAFTNLGAFYPNIHEIAIDRLCMLIQQVRDLATYPQQIVVTAGAASAATVVLSDASSSPQTVQLPPSGEVVIIKIDATENAVTITPGTGGQTIMGLAAVDLLTQYEPARLLFNGSTWYRI